MINDNPTYHRICIIIIIIFFYFVCPAITKSRHLTEQKRTNIIKLALGAIVTIFISVTLF